MNFKIELIKERSKNMKFECIIGIMAVKKDSEIEVLKCEIKSLDTTLDKCINNFILSKMRHSRTPQRVKRN